MKIEVRIFVQQGRKCVDGIGLSLPIYLDPRHRCLRFPIDGERAHGQAIFSTCDRARLVRGVSHWNEHHFIQVARFPGVSCQCQMPDVDRVERPTKDRGAAPHVYCA